MRKCHTLFCDAEQHADDLHVDVTGHTWREPLSAEPVIARGYDGAGNATDYTDADRKYDEWRARQDDEREMRLGETRGQSRAAGEDRDV